MNTKLRTLHIAALLGLAHVMPGDAPVTRRRPEGTSGQPVPRFPEVVGPPKPQHTNARQTARYARQMARDRAKAEKRQRERQR